MCLRRLRPSSLVPVAAACRHTTTHKIALKTGRRLAEASSVHTAFASARDTCGQQRQPATPNNNSSNNNTVVLQNLSQSFQLTPLVTVSGQQLWNASRIAREKSELRAANKVFVTGGASAIRRIWRRYRIQPNVVYVPDTEAVPDWCLGKDLPAVIVRTSPVDINRSLLSAEMNDGFAAEFPMPAHPPLELALHKPEPTEVNVPATSFRSVLVLYRVMVPGNVGLLCRAAVDRGYDAVVLCGCADPYSEKVVRASAGSILHPQLKVFQLPTSSNIAPVLQQLALSHNLLPIFGVPSQDAASPFAVAKKFHEVNAQNKSDPSRRLGAMIILGSESMGLGDLETEWKMPFQAVTIPMSNAYVDSINVAVAGSILLNHFRPRAAEEFERIIEAHRCADQLSPSSSQSSADSKLLP